MLRDPSFEIKLPTVGESLGNRTATLILDEEGRWCDIPCVSDTSTLLNLVNGYFKPRIGAEIQRLEQLRMIVNNSSEVDKKIVLGVGLFYYEPPDSGMIEEEEWRGAVVQLMRSAGVPAENIPSHLAPSINPLERNFFDSEVDPLDYKEVPDLMVKTFILCAALSRFAPNRLSGESLAIGYKAAIAIDGAALLGLLKDEIHEDEDHPEHSRVFTKTVHNVVKGLLEQ